MGEFRDHLTVKGVEFRDRRHSTTMPVSWRSAVHTKTRRENADSICGTVAWVVIPRYRDDDLGLMRALNTDEVCLHGGGVESEDRMLARHQRFLAGEPAGPSCASSEARECRWATSGTG